MPSLTRSSSTSRPLDLAALRSELLRAAALRQEQLLSLRPLRPGDRVAAEHHASVRRLYDDIHAALDRMDAGTFGDCTRCGTWIPPERLHDRVWVAECEPCARRSR